MFCDWNKQDYLFVFWLVNYYSFQQYSSDRLKNLFTLSFIYNFTWSIYSHENMKVVIKQVKFESLFYLKFNVFFSVHNYTFETLKDLSKLYNLSENSSAKMQLVTFVIFFWHLICIFIHFDICIQTKWALLYLTHFG